MDANCGYSWRPFAYLDDVLLANYDNDIHLTVKTAEATLFWRSQRYSNPLSYLASQMCYRAKERKQLDHAILITEKFGTDDGCAIGISKIAIDLILEAIKSNDINLAMQIASKIPQSIFIEWIGRILDTLNPKAFEIAEKMVDEIEDDTTKKECYERIMNYILLYDLKINLDVLNAKIANLTPLSSSILQDSNHYKTLGVPCNATLRQIKKAYHKLAKDQHADKNHGDEHAEAKMQKINLAAEVLTKPQNREKYAKLHPCDLLKNRKTFKDTLISIIHRQIL